MMLIKNRSVVDHTKHSTCTKHYQVTRRHFIVFIYLFFSGSGLCGERRGAGVSAVVYQRPAAWSGRRLPAGLPAGVQLQLWAGHQQHPGGPVSPKPGQNGPSHAKVTAHTDSIHCFLFWTLMLCCLASHSCVWRRSSPVSSGLWRRSFQVFWAKDPMCLTTMSLTSFARIRWTCLASGRAGGKSTSETLADQSLKSPGLLSIKQTGDKTELQPD